MTTKKSVVVDRRSLSAVLKLVKKVLSYTEASIDRTASGKSEPQSRKLIVKINKQRVRRYICHNVADHPESDAERCSSIWVMDIAK